VSNIIDFNSRFKQQADKQREADKPLIEMTREGQLHHLDEIETRLDRIIALLEADSELAPGGTPPASATAQVDQHRS